MVTIILSLATVTLSAAVIILSLRIGHTEDEVYEIKKSVNIVGGQADSGSEDIDEIISRLNDIVKDIHQLDERCNRLNERSEQDHRDLVDIRSRYVNFRDPVVKNGGVSWAGEIKTDEDNEQND